MYNKFKYKVQEFLDKMPALQRDEAMTRIPIELGITRQTLYKIRTCKRDEVYSPNSDNLIALSEFFGVTANDLLYERVSNAQEIFDDNQSVIEK